MNKVVLSIVLLLIFQGCSRTIPYEPINLNSVRRAIRLQMNFIPKEAEISGTIFVSGASYPFYALYKKMEKGYAILFFDSYMHQTGQIVYDRDHLSYEFVQKNIARYMKFFKPISKRFDSLLFGKISLGNLDIKQEGKYIRFSENGLDFKMKIDKFVLVEAKTDGMAVEYGDEERYRGIWITKRMRIFDEGIKIAEFNIAEIK